MIFFVSSELDDRYGDPVQSLCEVTDCGDGTYNFWHSEGLNRSRAGKSF